MIIIIVPQYVIYVLIYDYLKLRNDPSITSQEIANYISVALAVALSVWYKPFKTLLDRNQWADFDETWYEASETRAYFSLFK